MPDPTPTAPDDATPPLRCGLPAAIGAAFGIPDLDRDERTVYFHMVDERGREAFERVLAERDAAVAELARLREIKRLAFRYRMVIVSMALAAPDPVPEKLVREESLVAYALDAELARKETT